ncbi:unnamed protein product [Pleuronectes platessa]|uniref:Uncharacterized protein n=1 Tax=Pleuronectes platessa TaxID=8262 RepID=A0A9N7YLD9_PLEPL|nr:unnamed protein product [Pleuronectes platessa]
MPGKVGKPVNAVGSSSLGQPGARVEVCRTGIPHARSERCQAPPRSPFYIQNPQEPSNPNKRFLFISPAFPSSNLHTWRRETCRVTESSHTSVVAPHKVCLPDRG